MADDSRRAVASDIRYSVVIPCYNSGPWIDELVERVDKTMSSLKGQYELVLVDDASPDQHTWEEISRLAELSPQVRGIQLSFNVGQFRALLCGFEASEGEYIITMDDDLQNPPEEIPKLVMAIDGRPELDAVIGSYESKKHSLFRNLGTRLIASLYAHGFNKPKPLQTTSFRILRRHLVETISRHGTVRPIVGALILQSTARVINVQVDHRARPYGQSGYSFSRLASVTFDNIINGSIAPLRLVGVIGMLVSLISFGLGVAYLVLALTNQFGQSGFATIVLLLFFFGGLTLAALGLIGEYLVRVVGEVTAPPRYVIRRRVD